MNKAIIAPIVAGVALALKLGTGYELPETEQNIIVDAVLALLTVAGIFMNPKKKDPSQ